MQSLWVLRCFECMRTYLRQCEHTTTLWWLAPVSLKQNNHVTNFDGTEQEYGHGFQMQWAISSQRICIFHLSYVHPKHLGTFVCALRTIFITMHQKRERVKMGIQNKDTCAWRLMKRILAKSWLPRRQFCRVSKSAMWRPWVGVNRGSWMM